jgi:hypothetical protein
MELEGSLLEYEALKSRPFLVNGKPYLDVIYEAKETVQQKVKKGGTVHDTLYIDCEIIASCDHTQDT